MLCEMRIYIMILENANIIDCICFVFTEDVQILIS